LRNVKMTQAKVEDAIFVRADLTGADNVPSLRGLDTTGAVGLPGVKRGQVLRWLALAAAAVVVLALAARFAARSRGISRELE